MHGLGPFKTHLTEGIHKMHASSSRRDENPDCDRWGYDSDEIADGSANSEEDFTEGKKKLFQDLSAAVRDFHINDDFLHLPRSVDRSKYVQRLIVLDGLNIMHGMKSLSTMQMSMSGVLVLTRFFLNNDFDVFVVIPRTCYNIKDKDMKIRHANMIPRLNDLSLLIAGDVNSYDDTLGLRYARSTGGIFISNDRFCSHVDEADSEIRSNYLNMKYRAITKRSKEMKYSISSNGHMIMEHGFSFELFGENRWQTFWAPVDQLCGAIAEETRDMITTKERTRQLGEVTAMLNEIRTIELSSLDVDSKTDVVENWTADEPTIPDDLLIFD